ncbi:uncharacterized protein BBA_03630 [Beauveria bassiana ARSEF 2860]|uniref:Expansin-like EG45 domain-containing protein n=1 Tax=Beauveria bassiana (strain ARSEF 2860) TaxID=655819 RepID=J5JXR7_BEAB2|nr:uncharacterized protein BBA_03630 [Beauveria bassiana ARSEF 2860]EJP67056.1 hypothetical protein BBA_03630 [Beauveria bassiana ARSEF 2860]
MGLVSALMLAASLVFQIAAVEGSSIARSVDVPAAAGETDLAAIVSDPTDLLPDGKTCCPSGLEPAVYAAKNHRCEYGSRVSAYVAVSDDKVQACCFDVKAPKFYVHYLDLEKGLRVPVEIRGSSPLTKGDFCSLQLYYGIEQANVANNWFSVRMSLGFDCANYYKSSKEWITIFFNRNYLHAGRFTYDIPPFGTIIYADVAAKIISAGTVGLKFHLQGSGIVSGLNQTVEVQIENDTLKGFLKDKEICA